VYGAGIALSFVPVTIAALAGAPEEEAGLASGLINTSQQIGGAIGVAVTSTVAYTHVNDLLATGKAANVALTEGFQRGFWVVALVGAAALLVAIVFIRRDEVTVPETEAAAEVAGT
jgi:sugar phosphate permease